MKHRFSYVASALLPCEHPKLLDPQGNPLPEIALAGRSNAGKSTLVNLLSGDKHLAKVAAIPGKTQRLQFFSNGFLTLVDLPGYGFAKAPASLQAEWSAAIDIYLNYRENLCCLILLLDARREPSPDDLALAAWASARPIPWIPCFTKTDLLSPSEALRSQESALRLLSPDRPLRPIHSSLPAAHLWASLKNHIPKKAFP